MGTIVLNDTDTNIFVLKNALLIQKFNVKFFQNVQRLEFNQEILQLKIKPFHPITAVVKKDRTLTLESQISDFLKTGWRLWFLLWIFVEFLWMNLTWDLSDWAQSSDRSSGSTVIGTVVLIWRQYDWMISIFWIKISLLGQVSELFYQGCFKE